LFVGVADYLPSVGDPFGKLTNKKDLPSVGFFLLYFNRLQKQAFDALSSNKKPDRLRRQVFFSLSG
jgi:hypothetical protein